MTTNFAHSNGSKSSDKFYSLFQAVSKISIDEGINEFQDNFTSGQTNSSIQKLSMGLQRVAQEFNPAKGLDEIGQKFLHRSYYQRSLGQKIVDSIGKVVNKSGQGIQQLAIKFQQIQISSDSEEQQNNDNKNNQNERMETENDNQFMGKEFGSFHKLEEVKKYCADLNNEAIDSYVHKIQAQQGKPSSQAIIRIFQILEKSLNLSFKHILQCLKQCKGIENNRQSESERPSTGVRQIIKGSAQSHRIKSASKKGSDAGSDQFNFDLTVKTRNSKNAFKSLIKQDSLMYSAQSDFGYHPSSPKKQNQFKQEPKTQNKQLHQIKDTEEDLPALRSVDKSQSQEYDPSNSDQPQKSERSQKLQKQEHQQNLSQKPQQIKSNEADNDNQFQIPSNLSHKNDKFEQMNSSIKPQKSVRQQIENYSDGFYADDEDQKQFESARYEKKQFEKIFKKRVGTQIAVVKNSVELPKKNVKRFNKVDFTKEQKISHSSSQVNIFSTEISNYQSKIAKLKQVKQLKRKKLQEQLAKVNHQIKVLHEKQQQMSPHNRNHYASRAKISDNVDAKKKAQSLVKNLRSQKRNRNMAKVGEFKSLDKNINEYMEQLNKLRAENEQKTKQKKKLEILQRMKQHEIRKMNDRKKIEANQQFVMHLKSPTKEHESPNDKKSRVIEKEDGQIEVVTPQLSQKKAYLNKIRSFSTKKTKRDVYEQVLS